ncbi:hypothetical protein BDV96DRAFT_3182 [Lophiotrema nucula]|uniref:Uncharacterized protein n=1 Tax=Lophiotrema nucula TaxID=690887 RepID=A0A6A5ZUF3_9PLEO|nr:hypothetical protein BDV96DRAFT_3182 [Lophiotrema nucula]
MRRDLGLAADENDGVGAQNGRGLPRSCIARTKAAAICAQSSVALEFGEIAFPAASCCTRSPAERRASSVERRASSVDTTTMARGQWARGSLWHPLPAGYHVAACPPIDTAPRESVERWSTAPRKLLSKASSSSLTGPAIWGMGHYCSASALRRIPPIAFPFALGRQRPQTSIACTSQGPDSRPPALDISTSPSAGARCPRRPHSC